jgi:molybdopterin converting factor subunit 1
LSGPERLLQGAYRDRYWSFMKRIKVLFFATLRDRAGTKSVDLEIPAETTVQGLKNLVTDEYPGLKETMDTVVISINREFAFDESDVPEKAEVAMFPPVSGG